MKFLSKKNIFSLIFAFSYSITILVLIYLFVNYDFIEFETLVSLYFLLSGIFILLSLYYVSKGKNFGAAVFVLSFIYFLFWLPFGFNLTDEGYAIVLAFFQGGSNDPFYYTVQSGYIIFDKWLKLSTNSIFWSRTFFALFMSAENWISFLIINQLILFKKNLLNLLFFIANATLVSLFLNFFIPYDQFHFLLLFTALLISLYAHKKQKNWLLLFSGILIVWMAFSRFTFLILLILFLLFLYLWGLRKFKAYLWLFSGILIGFILFVFAGGSPQKFLIYSYHTLKGTEILDCCIFTTASYEFKALLDKYIFQSGRILYYVFFWWLFLFHYYLMKKERFSKIAIYIYMVAVSAYMIFYFLNKPYVYEKFYAMTGLILSFSFFTISKILRSKKLLILYTFLLIPVGLSFAGSKVGMAKIFLSGSYFVLFPLTLILLKQKNKPLSIFLPFIIIIFTQGWKFYRTYQDLPVKNLNAVFNVKPLKGIISKKEKIRDIEDFYHQIKNYDIRNKYIIVGRGHLIPYLVNQKPYFYCWKVSDDDVIKGLKKSDFQYVIYIRKKTNSADWYLKRKEKFLKDYAYEKVYQYLKINSKLIFNHENLFLFYENDKHK